jgi:hypothetical protein
MAYLFTAIARKGSKQGMKPNADKAAREWFRSSAADIVQANPKKLLNNRQNVQSSIQGDDIGKMFMFFYDPKFKFTLPKYDIFPLVFPIEMYDDGFLGINLHYLSGGERAQLMDALYNLASDDKYDENTTLIISYRILNGAARFGNFKQCVKRYLFSHVQGGFLFVAPENWDTALMLPTERFRSGGK